MDFESSKLTKAKINRKQRKELFLPAEAQPAPKSYHSTRGKTLSSVGSNQKILKGVYRQYETKPEAALNLKKKKSPPKHQSLVKSSTYVQGYWRQFKIFSTLSAPCRRFSSSPRSSAIGSQHSHITWQTKKHFLPNQSSAALVRWLFLHLTPVSAPAPRSSGSNCKFSLPRILARLHRQWLSDQKGYRY